MSVVSTTPSPCDITSEDYNEGYDRLPPLSGDGTLKSGKNYF